MGLHCSTPATSRVLCSCLWSCCSGRLFLCKLPLQNLEAENNGNIYFTCQSAIWARLTGTIISVPLSIGLSDLKAWLSIQITRTRQAGQMVRLSSGSVFTMHVGAVPGDTPEMLR